jgi:site-specific recombinase XerD
MLMTIDEAANDYLNHLRHERMVAKTTVYTYSSWLSIFRRWLEENGHKNAELTAFTTPTLRSYQYSMSARKLRPRTIRGAFHPLRGLAAFLIGHGAIKENPCAGLTMPKKDAAIRLTISQGEVIALLTGADRLHPERRATLAKAMVMTMVYTGLRFQEVLDLKVSDVKLDARTLLVASGKGDKSHLLYPPSPCLEALSEWLAVRDIPGSRGPAYQHEWLWADTPGRRVGCTSFRNLLEEVKAAAGLREHDNIKPHSLRHFFATNLDQNGAPLKVIQAALGHSSAQTTLIYLHSTEKDTQRMADFSNIRELLPPARTTETNSYGQAAPKTHAQDKRLRRQGPTRQV